MLVAFYIFMALIMVGSSLAISWIMISLVALLFIRVPYVNTPRQYCEKVFDEINVKGLTVYDLGCGDAYFLSKCAKKGAKKCVGYELSPMAYMIASIRTLAKPIKIKFGDFFKADISEADVVYIYLVKNIVNKLSPKLKSEAKKGCKVIIIGSSFIDWKPEKVISLNGDYSAYIYKNS